MNECLNEDSEKTCLSLETNPQSESSEIDPKSTDEFKLNEICLDLNNERNARYWLMLRDEILNDDHAKKCTPNSQTYNFSALILQFILNQDFLPNKPHSTNATK